MQTTLSKIDEIRHYNPKQDLHNIDAHTKFGKNPLQLLCGNENMDTWQADNSVKNWHNSSNSNPNSDLHNTNAHTKFGENPLKFTYRPETKIRGMFEMNCLLSSSSISTWGTIKTNTYLYRAIQYLHNGV